MSSFNFLLLANYHCSFRKPRRSPAATSLLKNFRSRWISLPDCVERRLTPQLNASIITLMGEYNAIELDALFGAIADATRRAILARLADSDARVTELAKAFPISLNSTSKHIRILERAGLVTRTVRGREHLLSLNARPMAEAAQWMAFYQRFWDQRLAALENFVINNRDTEKNQREQ